MTSGDGYDRIRENLRRILDTGASLSKLSREELEDIVREMLRGGGSGAEVVEDFVDEVRARSRRGMDLLAGLLRAEVQREHKTVTEGGERVIGELCDRLVGLFGEFLGMTGTKTSAGRAGEHAWEHRDVRATRVDSARGPTAPHRAETRGKKRPVPKKAAAKKAGAKKTAASTSRLRKSPAGAKPSKSRAAKKATPSRTPSGRSPR